MSDPGDEKFEEWWNRCGQILTVPKELFYNVFRYGYAVGRRIMAEETLDSIKEFNERHPQATERPG